MDLAVTVGDRLLGQLGDTSVDALVLATTSADRLCPAGAPEVAARLGLRSVAAFDIAAACSGFVYGLATSAGLITSSVARSVLLITAEAFSSMVDRDDRTTGALFGDGAAATIVRCGSDWDQPGVIGRFDLGSDGTGCDLLAIPAGGSRQRFGDRSDHFLQMNGAKVFEHAVLRLSASAQKALALADWTAEDVDRFVCHQANQRILNAVGRRIPIDCERTVSNVEFVGNTVSASVPIALAHAASVGQLGKGHRVLISAFGAGFSWGSTTLTWPDIPTELHSEGGLVDQLALRDVQVDAGERPQRPDRPDGP